MRNIQTIKVCGNCKAVFEKFNDNPDCTFCLKYGAAKDEKQEPQKDE